jgi:hypothetical protein
LVETARRSDGLAPRAIASRDEEKRKQERSHGESQLLAVEEFRFVHIFAHTVSDPTGSEAAPTLLERFCSAQKIDSVEVIAEGKLTSDLVGPSTAGEWARVLD